MPGQTCAGREAGVRQRHGRHVGGGEGRRTLQNKSAVIILRTRRVARTSRSSVLAIEFIATAAQCGTNNDLTAPGIRGLSARHWGNALVPGKCLPPPKK